MNIYTSIQMTLLNENTINNTLCQVKTPKLMKMKTCSVYLNYRKLSNRLRYKPTKVFQGSLVDSELAGIGAELAQSWPELAFVQK